MRRLVVPGLRWGLRILSAAFALALTVVFVARLAALDGTPSAKPAGSSLVLAGNDSGCSGHGIPQAIAYFVLSHMNPDENALEARPTLCLSDALLKTFRASRGGRSTPVFVETGNGLIVRHEFRDAMLSVQYADEAGGGSSTRIPLTAFDNDGSEADYTVPAVSLAATGFAGDFPLDVYTSRPAAELELLGALSFNDGGKGLLMANEASVTPDLHGYRVVSRQLGASSLVVISRDQTIKLFTILLALGPLILIGALSVILVSRPTKGTGTELVFGTAAVLLAILPIRSVLVPGDVSGLTLVDLALGWEVGMLTAMMAWTASGFIPSGGTPHGRDDKT